SSEVRRVAWAVSPTPRACRRRGRSHPAPPSEGAVSLEQGRRAAADPDGSVLLADVDPAVTPDARALACRVGGDGTPRGQEPLRDRRVEAAGDGVLPEGAVLVGEDGPEFE